MKAKLIEKFVSIYGEGGEIRSFFSPGRVNLIGEHTDYNGGHVFPCALSIGTYMIVRKREDRTIRFYSASDAGGSDDKSDQTGAGQDRSGLSDRDHAADVYPGRRWSDRDLE